MVGNSSAERFDASENCIEARDDNVRRHAAPTHNIVNGTPRCNVHVPGGVAPAISEPSTRFGQLVRGYQSLDTMTNTITDYFAAPQQGPPWRMINVVRDYNETDQARQNAQPDSTVREFYKSSLERFTVELKQIGGGRCHTR